jgi:hypothetical protein
MYFSISKQSKELKRQVSLSIKPAFLAYVELSENVRMISRIILTNIGNGYASSITISEVINDKNTNLIKPDGNPNFLNKRFFGLEKLKDIPLLKYRFDDQSKLPNNENYLLELVSEELIRKIVK